MMHHNAQELGGIVASQGALHKLPDSEGPPRPTYILL